MKVALIRHAEAVVLGTEGAKTDFDRFLSVRGQSQAAALAAALHRFDVAPGLILASPLVRAWQTAEILAATLTPGHEPVRCDRLALGERRFRRLSREVAEHDQELIFLVGHMPNLGEYADWLLGAEEGAIDFGKAAMALIKFPGPPAKKLGQLKWLVPPQWFIV